MKVGFAWMIGWGALVAGGCASAPPEAPKVTYRGPEVSIDVRPAGRAQTFASLPATPTPDEPPVRSKPRKRKPSPPRPKPRTAKPALPPDEIFYPDGRSSRRHRDEFDPGEFRVPDDGYDPAGDPGDPSSWGSYRVPKKKDESTVNEN